MAKIRIKKSDYEALMNAINRGISLATNKPVRKSSAPDVEVTKENYSFAKYLKGAITGDWTKAEEEKKIYKALNTTVGTEGGFLVPTQTSAEIIELLKAKAVVRSLPGVRVVDMDSKELEIGRIDSGPSITWGSENATISSDTSVEFGLVKLSLKKAVCLYPISRELIEFANASVDDLLKTELADALALAEDLAFLEGTGGNQPLGLYYHTAILNTDLSGALSYDDIAEAQMQVRAHNGEITAFVAHPKIEYALRTLKDSNGAYLFRPSLSEDPGKVPSVAGVPVHYTSQIPTTNRPGSNETYMIGGQWSNFIIGQKGDIRIETTTQGANAFEKDQVVIKAVRFVDCALRHPETFVRIVGIQ